MTEYAYEGVRRVVYGDGATFVPVCTGANGAIGEGCGRFVKADPTAGFDGEGNWMGLPNATCSKCGRVEMVFEGFI